MKRGSSGLSLIVAVNKPSGMTSHDVVNRCRRIFQERRVGHTGTLDPLATGVLPICVGPATRLDKYLTAHDKRYRVTIGFGFETTTDDIEGQPTVVGEVSDDLIGGDFAESYVSGLKGIHDQVPPAYSAIKVNGKKAYEAARAGVEVNLESRKVEIFDAVLVNRCIGADGQINWVVDFSVSKGTYIRALVRDMGRELGTPAHVEALERRCSGQLAIEDCMSLNTIEALGEAAAVDPVQLLGYRFAYADRFEARVLNGSKLSAESLELMQYGRSQMAGHCACFGADVHASPDEPMDNEFVSIVVANRLKAIYRFDSATRSYRPSCVFSTPVKRS